MKILPITNINNFRKPTLQSSQRVNFKGIRIDEESDLLDLYLHDITHYGRLSREEESKLAERIIADGDDAQNARLELMNANLKLVVDRALEKKKHSSVPIMDLIQEGNMGVYKATEKYNGEFAFSTYAVPWIDVSMQRAEFSKYSFIRLPEYTRTLLGNIKKAEIELLKEGITPTPEEISKKTNYPVTTINNLFTATSTIKSLNEKFDESDSDSDEYQNIIADEKAENPAEIMDKENLENEINELLSIFSDRTRGIIADYFGLFGTPQLSPSEIEEKYNKSYQEIQNQIKKCIARIKRESKGEQFEKLKEFLANNN